MSIPRSPPISPGARPAAVAHEEHPQPPMGLELGLNMQVCNVQPIQSIDFFRKSGDHSTVHVNLPISQLCPLSAAEEKRGRTEG